MVVVVQCMLPWVFVKNCEKNWEAQHCSNFFEIDSLSAVTQRRTTFSVLANSFLPACEKSRRDVRSSSSSKKIRLILWASCGMHDESPIRFCRRQVLSRHEWVTYVCACKTPRAQSFLHLPFMPLCCATANGMMQLHVASNSDSPNLEHFRLLVEADLFTVLCLRFSRKHLVLDPLQGRTCCQITPW